MHGKITVNGACNEWVMGASEHNGVSLHAVVFRKIGGKNIVKSIVSKNSAFNPVDKTAAPDADDALGVGHTAEKSTISCNMRGSFGREHENLAVTGHFAGRLYRRLHADNGNIKLLP